MTDKKRDRKQNPSFCDPVCLPPPPPHTRANKMLVHIMPG